MITLATNPCGRQPLGADDYFNAVRKGDMFLSQLVGPTLGRVAILDARGRSPHVRSGRPPIVGPRGRGSLPRLPAVGDGVRRSAYSRQKSLKQQRAASCQAAGSSTARSLLPWNHLALFDGGLATRSTRRSAHLHGLLPPIMSVQRDHLAQLLWYCYRDLFLLSRFLLSGCTHRCCGRDNRYRGQSGHHFA